MNLPVPELRERRLRALGVASLRLREPIPGSTAARSPAPEGSLAPEAAITPASAIRRLALQPDPAELADPAVRQMYSALTDAVAKVGLQPVRPCDVAADQGAAVIVFGAAPVPGGVPAARVLREDALAVLHADRAGKRRLWERMQAMGRDAVD
ncbi:MAG: hypothetical protein ACREPL_11265 [Rhodanobacteraceae bacterium]